jgi:ABC-type microcin C transport system duplicated ATPase subunit YejF
VGASIAEALSVHDVVPRAQRAGRVADLLAEVGLEDQHARRWPHQLSGGQRQRIIIARALAVEPRLLILDEPTSALDVTVQARILALIERLRRERDLAYVLISHNLAVVDRLCEHCLVLRDGHVVETGAHGAGARPPPGRAHQGTACRSARIAVGGLSSGRLNVQPYV